MTSGHEIALLQRARLGDGDAFTSLVAGEWCRLRRLAHRLVGNPADAEDVVQDAVWSAFRRIRGFRGDAQFSSWLFRITVNFAKTHRRREKLRNTRIEELPPPKLPTPEDLFAAGEFAFHLRQSLLLVSRRNRAALRLRTLGELSYGEIASVLRVPVSTVKVRIHRGRDELRRILRHRMGTS